MAKRRFESKEKAEAHELGEEMPEEAPQTIEPAQKKGKQKAKKDKKAKAAYKIPHVHEDFEMPTLAQVAGFVRKEAAKGTKALTATNIRDHFKVPGKIPMNTRLHQLETHGFGVFEKIDGSNTLRLDIPAITSGKAAVAEDRKGESGKNLKKAKKKTKQGEELPEGPSDEPKKDGEAENPEEAPV